MQNMAFGTIDTEVPFIENIEQLPQKQIVYFKQCKHNIIKMKMGGFICLLKIKRKISKLFLLLPKEQEDF